MIRRSFSRSREKPRKSFPGGAFGLAILCATAPLSRAANPELAPAPPQNADHSERRAPSREATTPDAGLARVKGEVRYEETPGNGWRYSRYYVHGASGSLAEAVVVLEPAVPLESPRASRIAVIDQENYQFIPETLAIRAGDSVRFKNSDGVLHNVMSADGDDPFNVNIGVGEDWTKTFEKPRGLDRPVRLGCVYHGGMRGWIYVFDHPWFQVTGSDGRFDLDRVPPGRYTLRIFHPAGRLKWEKPLTLGPSEVAALAPRLASGGQKHAGPPER